MLRRAILSTYNFYNIQHSTNILINCNRILPKSIFCRTAGNMSGENKIVNYDDVVSATKNSTVYIIDVREPNELQESGKIPNSINIPLQDVENALKTYSNNDFENKFGRSKPNSGTPIIFTCRSGKRAGMALDTALKLGFNNSKSYGGSWLDWEQRIKN